METDDCQILEAIEAIKKGQMIIVTDDEDRENEGDLVVAASFCTKEQMAFLIRYTSGIICAPLTASLANHLKLPLMVQENDSAYHTAFTISIDYKHGTTTGISADDRSLTVQNLANPKTIAEDFLRPGHIFPLIAKENGVLDRSGHTEAAVDLCRLANLKPIGVIGELMNDDGSVKRGDEIKIFAKEHNLLIITVSALASYRKRKNL